MNEFVVESEIRPDRKRSSRTVTLLRESNSLSLHDEMQWRMRSGLRRYRDKLTFECSNGSVERQARGQDSRLASAARGSFRRREFRLWRGRAGSIKKKREREKGKETIARAWLTLFRSRPPPVVCDVNNLEHHEAPLYIGPPGYFDPPVYQPQFQNVKLRGRPGRERRRGERGHETLLSSNLSSIQLVVPRKSFSLGVSGRSSSPSSLLPLYPTYFIATLIRISVWSCYIYDTIASRPRTVVLRR